MTGIGVRDPGRNALIGAAITVVSWSCVAWGAVEMRDAEPDALGPALKVGLGLLPAMFGPLIILNFWYATRVFAALRRGTNVIGRWRLSAAQLAAFTAAEAARSAPGIDFHNAWTPPASPAPDGIEVIFAPDGVLLGDIYFPLGTMGVFRVTGVRMLRDDPPAIDFRTVLTSANRFGARNLVHALRIPLPRDVPAEAEAILGHFERIVSRELVLRPHRFRRLAWVALVVAAVGFAAAAGGFAMLRSGRGGAIDPELPFVIGLLVGMAALGVAALAWALDRGQRRRA